MEMLQGQYDSEIIEHMRQHQKKLRTLQWRKNSGSSEMFPDTLEQHVQLQKKRFDQCVKRAQDRRNRRSEAIMKLSASRQDGKICVTMAVE
mmetsp:Transcript_37224/g.68680  ORF Transcript_37224/g.68680 Transcript_37224/m.68680 type:complete len:91 (+) Transcript_37224:229-501(+)